MSNVWPIYYSRFRARGIKRLSQSEPLEQGCVNVIILEAKVSKPIYYSEFVTFGNTILHLHVLGQGGQP
jgi:hypothetical protein